MTEILKLRMPVGAYLLLGWMIINTIMLLLLIPGDLEDLNNYIEPVLWVGSIAGLVSMKKAGAAFVTTVLSITLSTSMFNVLISYYSGNLAQPVGIINAFRIALNAIAIIYMWKQIFSGRFK